MAPSVLYPEVKRPIGVSLWSIITCPGCGWSKLEAISEEVTLSYACTECEEVLEPQSWECCVYCSYGSVRCAKAQSRHA